MLPSCRFVLVAKNSVFTGWVHVISSIFLALHLYMANLFGWLVATGKNVSSLGVSVDAVVGGLSVLGRKLCRLR